MKTRYLLIGFLVFSFSMLLAQKTEMKVNPKTSTQNATKLNKQSVDSKSSINSAYSTQAVNVVTYDFTVAGAAYVDPNKGNPPMVDLSGTGVGPFAMAAGDANGDGNVTTLDLTIWLPDNNTAASGYLNSDMNMDGNVTTLDLTKWLPSNNTAMSTHVPN